MVVFFLSFFNQNRFLYAFAVRKGQTTRGTMQMGLGLWLSVHCTDPSLLFPAKQRPLKSR